MSDKCNFPLCKQNIKPGSDMCFSHTIKFGAPKMKAKPKAIAAKSKKRIADDKIYKKIVEEMAAITNKCEIKSPVCTGSMQGADHLQKRSPNNLTDRNNLVRACNACNLFKEENPTHPISKKFSISRFKN